MQNNKHSICCIVDLKLEVISWVTYSADYTSRDMVIYLKTTVTRCYRVCSRTHAGQPEVQPEVQEEVRNFQNETLIGLKSGFYFVIWFRL